MRTVTLTRNETSDEGTFGTLVVDSFTCRTGELPWRGNATGTSCIPTGIYVCQWLPSPKHGMCYHVEDVPGRSDVEIHVANWMGDKSLGYQSEMRGCIALGKDVGPLAGQRGLYDSAEALREFVALLNEEPFELIVSERLRSP